MDRKQQVFVKLKLKAKALGFNSKELKGIAAKIADNLESQEDASEEDVNAEIDEKIEAVLPYLTFGQSQANRLLDEWKKNHPEQLHQLHFGHPYITAWDVHPADFADCYNSPFHNHIAIEISLNDWLSRLPNVVKSLSIFSVVILAYFCVVVMFVCPNIRLTLSMGIPLLKARVANP